MQTFVLIKFVKSKAVCCMFLTSLFKKKSREPSEDPSEEPSEESSGEPSGGPSGEPSGSGSGLPTLQNRSTLQRNNSLDLDINISLNDDGPSLQKKKRKTPFKKTEHTMKLRRVIPSQTSDDLSSLPSLSVRKRGPYKKNPAKAVVRIEKLQQKLQQEMTTI